MLITKSVPIESEVPVTVCCNLCGRSADLQHPDAWCEGQDFHEFAAEGRYGSTFPDDLVRLVWHAFGACLKAWLASCVVSPEAFERSLALPGGLTRVAPERGALQIDPSGRIS